MDTQKDDRILSFTRIVAAAVTMVLVTAFYALYLNPTRTDTLFSWTILPPSTAIFMGAGYTAGAFFFVRLLGQKKWHTVSAGFIPITVFTVFMLLSTFLHWNRFHLGTLIFYLWTGIYIITPFLVPFIWWHNRRTDPGILDENDLRFSRFVRWSLGGIAAAGMLGFLVFFIRPAILIAIFPWKLTELTARIFCGWGFVTLVSILSIAVDGRWSAARIPVESGVVGIFLLMIALPRMVADLDPLKPMTYVFIAGLAAALLTLIVTHVWLDRSSRIKVQSRRAGSIEG
jgi:hypothetical protein